MAEPPFRPLEDPEREWIADARNWIKGHFGSDPDENYASVDGKLDVLGAILDNGWVQPDETAKLQAMGIAFGDALAQKLMLDWVTIDDEYGRTPALNWPGTSIVSFPVTMIAKRVEEGEEIEIHGFFDGTCKMLSDMAHSGQAT